MEPKDIGMTSKVEGNFGVSYVLIGIWDAKRVQRLLCGYLHFKLVDEDLWLECFPVSKRKCPVVGFGSKPEHFHNMTARTGFGCSDWERVSINAGGPTKQ